MYRIYLRLRRVSAYPAAIATTTPPPTAHGSHDGDGLGVGEGPGAGPGEGFGAPPQLAFVMQGSHTSLGSPDTSSGGALHASDMMEEPGGHAVTVTFVAFVDVLNTRCLYHSGLSVYGMPYTLPSHACCTD